MLRKGRKDALDTYNLENEDLRELRDLFVRVIAINLCRLASDCMSRIMTQIDSECDSERLEHKK